MQKKNVPIWFFIFFGFYTVRSEGAPKNYRIIGTIEEITPQSFSVQSETESFEFKRDNANLKIPGDAKVGDQVTVWYTMEAQKIKVGKGILQNQQPAEADPNRHIRLDDRVFYDARNIEKKHENHEGNG